MTVSWYRKVYTGAKLHTAWQTGIGITIFLTFVVIPTWVEYISAVSDKRFLGKAKHNSNIQEMVYNKSVALREMLKNKD